MHEMTRTAVNRSTAPPSFKFSVWFPIANTERHGQTFYIWNKNQQTPRSTFGKALSAFSSSAVPAKEDLSQYHTWRTCVKHAPDGSITTAECFSQGKGRGWAAPLPSSRAPCARNGNTPRASPFSNSSRRVGSTCSWVLSRTILDQVSTAAVTTRLCTARRALPNQPKKIQLRT